MVVNTILFILFSPLIIVEAIYIAITKGKKSTLEIYEKCQTLFFPDYVFSVLLFFVTPYTCTIFPHVISMKKGSTKVQMKYRFLVRNPFNSIHAAALTNLGEFTSALTVLNYVHGKARAIPIGIQIDFAKKARGVVTASCDCTIEKSKLTGEKKDQYDAVTIITDENGEHVCRVITKFNVKFYD